MATGPRLAFSPSGRRGRFSLIEGVALVHGAPGRQDAFKAALEGEGYRGLVIPERGHHIEI